MLRPNALNAGIVAEVKLRLLLVLNEHLSIWVFGFNFFTGK